VIIWRCDTRRIKYDWLADGWGNSEQPQWNASRERLSTTIHKLLQSADALSYEAIVQVNIFFCFFCKYFEILNMVEIIVF
jgi:DnaJ homolog subfamily C member 16